MERTVLNGPVDATSSFHPSRSTANGASTTSWKRQLLLLARLLFLGSALGVLVWRLVADGGGALDAARRIGLATLLGSFLAAAAGTGASGLAWRSLLRGLDIPVGLRAAARVFLPVRSGSTFRAPSGPTWLRPGWAASTGFRPPAPQRHR